MGMGTGELAKGIAFQSHMHVDNVVGTCEGFLKDGSISECF